MPSEGPGVDWTHPILATRLLCGGLVAAHLLGAAWLWLTMDADLLAMLFLDRPRELRIAVGGQHQVLIERGAQWRWLSSVFLHTGAVHLAVNVTGLWALGRLLEPWIGGARWLRLHSAPAEVRRAPRDCMHSDRTVLRRRACARMRTCHAAACVP